MRVKALSDKRTPYVILAIVFLFGLYLRLDPFLYAPDLPYGITDATFHYQVGMMLYEGRSIDYVWNGIGRNLRVDKFYYPPLSYYLPAYAARVTGDFQHTVYPVNALFSSLAILTTFILCRELFGEYPALVSALFIALSGRDISSMMWGQWPAGYSLTFLPLALYAAVKSVKSPKYLYFCAVTVGLCMLTYPQTAIYAVVCSVGFLLLNLPYRLKFSGKHAMLSVAILLALSSPLIYKSIQYVSHVSEENSGGFQVSDMMFLWYPLDPKSNFYPQAWYDVVQTYTIFGASLAFGGFAVLIISRRSKKAVMPLMLTSVMIIMLFLALHLSAAIAIPRAVKFILVEPYLMSVLVAVPFSSGLSRDRRVMLAAAILLAGFVLTITPMLWNTGERLFPVGVRMTPAQKGGFMWLREHSGEKSLVVYQGYHDVMHYWGSVISDRQILRSSAGRYYFMGDDTPLTGEVYVFFDSNTPFMPQVARDEALNRLSEVNKGLDGISSIVFQNDEVFIRKFSPNNAT